MSQICINDDSAITNKKITDTSYTTTKVRTIPENFEALKQQVKAPLYKGKANDQFIMSELTAGVLL